MKQSDSKRLFVTRTFLGAAALVLAACSSGDPIAPDTAPQGAREALTDSSSNSPSPNPTADELPTPEPMAKEEPAAPSAAAPAPAQPEDTTTASMTSPDSTPDPAPDAAVTPENSDEPAIQVATLGAGCFWCIEAVLEQVEGVESVVSGYTGGQTLNPTYKEICTGQTGHAEVVQVTFDSRVITYAELLDWFWKSHDPTTLNRQGNDRGTQYRSAIFVHSPEQRRIAETSKKDVQPTFADPIVTEVTDAVTFYEAEKYHQGYYFDNTRQGYCRAIIAPKLKKLGLKY